MQVGSYDTKRGRRFRIELKDGKVIKGLTKAEYHEIYYGMWNRCMSRGAK